MCEYQGQIRQEWRRAVQDRVGYADHGGDAVPVGDDTQYKKPWLPIAAQVQKLISV